MPRGQKFPVEVMLRVVREVDNGVPVAVVCRKVGMVEKKFYGYREKYAGMEASDASPGSLHRRSHSSIRHSGVIGTTSTR
jgi:hypothetical protein